MTTLTVIGLLCAGFLFGVAVGRGPFRKRSVRDAFGAVRDLKTEDYPALIELTEQEIERLRARILASTNSNHQGSERGRDV